MKEVEKIFKNNIQNTTFNLNKVFDELKNNNLKEFPLQNYQIFMALVLFLSIIQIILISCLKEQEVVSGFMGSQKKHIVESL